MNVFLLDDAENYPNELENNFPEWKTTGVNYLSNKLSVWDWLKYNIRNHAISYFKRKAKKRNAKEKLLPPAYKEAIKQYEEDPSSLYQDLLNDAKEVLERFYDEETKGIIIRARARWHEHFLTLENRNNSKKHIRKTTYKWRYYI